MSATTLSVGISFSVFDYERWPLCRSCANCRALPKPFRGDFKFRISIGKDYIAEPKVDGYRGIHLIAEYCGESDGYRGFQIEIQARTKLQHLWATSVEVCQFFRQQRFKTANKPADEKWLRDLAFAGGYIALLENAPPVPGTPAKVDDVYSEMAKIDEEIGIVAALSNWTLLNNVQLIELRGHISIF